MTAKFNAYVGWGFWARMVPYEIPVEEIVEIRRSPDGAWLEIHLANSLVLQAKGPIAFLVTRGRQKS